MVPPAAWGVTADSELVDPTITVRVSGVGATSPLTATSRPGGSVATVRSTVRGWMSTEAVSVRPPLSVAVARISRYEGCSWSGAANDPPATSV